MHQPRGAASGGPRSAAASPVSHPVALLPLRFDRHELAGGIADIGVMLPLAVAIAASSGLDLTMMLLCVAAVYALTALVFRVPVPVQPMKAMAAAIIALGLSPAVVGAAGLEIGALLLLVAITPLARWLARLFPRPVVRGIQLAIGLLLLKSALVMAGAASALPGVGAAVVVGPLTATAGTVVALAIAIFLLAGKRRPRLPGVLLVLGIGVVSAIVLAATGVWRPGPAPAGVVLLPPGLPSLADAWLAFIAIVLPQLPLSLGNAVFATDDALHHYYGPAARRVTPARLCLSMGLADLGCGLLGGAPLCHGSGGATAHYRLGARTAGATLTAAGLFVALATVAALGLSPAFIPGAVLAGMLVFVGVEHMLLVTDLTAADDVLCAALIAGVALASGNLAIGFVAGWALLTVLRYTPLHRLDLRWPDLTRRLAPAPEPVELKAR